MHFWKYQISTRIFGLCQYFLLFLEFRFLSLIIFGSIFGEHFWENFGESLDFESSEYFQKIFGHQMTGKVKQPKNFGQRIALLYTERQFFLTAKSYLTGWTIGKCHKRPLKLFSSTWSFLTLFLHLLEMKMKNLARI